MSSAERPPTRHERREAERAAAKGELSVETQPRASGLRAAIFAVVVVAILGVGVALASSDLVGQRGTASTAGTLPVRMSMAGFDPHTIRVKAGTTVAIDFWTTDAAPHLQGGVHTFISDELRIHEELPAESRRTFTFTAPTTPGDYDVYCDTCCGGKASPTMHGTLRVEA